MKPALGPASAFLGPVYTALGATGRRPEGPLDGGLKAMRRRWRAAALAGADADWSCSRPLRALKETGPHSCGPVSRFWGGGAAMRYVAPSKMLPRPESRLNSC